MNFLGIDEDKLKTEISKEDFAKFEEANKRVLEEALQMECPICRSKLVLGQGTKKYETLSDHVCDPNRKLPDRPYFVCPNEVCRLHGNSFWDNYGEFYTCLNFTQSREIFGISIEEDYRNTNPKCCKAAYNSHARQSWFEIYYKEQSKRYFIGKLGFYFYNKITADKFGNIVKRKKKIEWLEKQRDDCVVVKVWGSHMFIHMLQSCYRKYKSFKKNKTTYDLEELKKACDKNHWINKGDWWRVSSCFINRILYRNIIKEN